MAEKLTLEQKLLELQKSVRGLSKDAENKGFRYQYVSGSKLLSFVRPKMDELGLRLRQDVIPDSIKLNGNSIFMLINFTWVDTDSGETLRDVWPASGINNSLDKAIGSAMTYSERYYLMKQLHIATDEDDADAIEPEPIKQKPNPRTSKARPEQQSQAQDNNKPRKRIEADDAAEMETLIGWCFSQKSIDDALTKIFVAYDWAPEAWDAFTQAIKERLEFQQELHTEQ